MSLATYTLSIDINGCKLIVLHTYLTSSAVIEEMLDTYRVIQSVPLFSYNEAAKSHCG